MRAVTPIRMVARSLTWTPLLGATAISTIVVVIASSSPAALPLQAAAILLASAAGFALDDPAAGTLAASPTSLLRRRLRRVELTVVPALAVWWALLVVHGTENARETAMLAALSAGVTAIALAAAGVVTRWRDLCGGYVAGPALLVAIVLSSAVPPRWRPLPLGDIPGGWTAIVLRWSLAAVLATLALLASSRDPVAGRMARRHRG